MAYDSEKIFGIIRKLLQAGGPPPSKTSICQTLIAERVVNSMGTAHKYVGAFFAADALKAEFRAPQADDSALPDRVRTAFETLVAASGALRNEMAAAMEDLTIESSAAFGKMVVANNAAQQSEFDELSAELDRTYDRAETLQTRVSDEVGRREAIEAGLAERESALAEAAASVEALRTALEVEQAKTASLTEALDGKTKVVAALESERLLRDRRDAQMEQEIASQREQIHQLRNELEQSRSPEGAVVRTVLPGRNSGGSITPADAI